MTELTREQIYRRNESAKRLLSDETILAAWESIQAECALSWANSGPHQQELRDDAYRLARCIKLVKLKLETWAADASVTEHRNDKVRKAAEYA